MADKYNIVQHKGNNAKVMRTVYFTLCEGDELDENNGRSHQYFDVLIGKFTPFRATRYLNKQAIGKRVRITRTVIMSQLVGMDFWQFWQYAEASNDPEKVCEYILEKKVSND